MEDSINNSYKEDSYEDLTLNNFHLYPEDEDYNKTTGKFEFEWKTLPVKDDTKNKTNYIQGLIYTIAAAVFNCFVDRIFNLLPTSVSAFLNSGITVCSTSTLLACGMGASIYLVSRFVLSYLQGEKHSTLRREVTDLLVTAVAGAVLNMIVTVIFAEAQIVIIPTLLAGATIGAGIYIITKIVGKIMQLFSSNDEIENDGDDDNFEPITEEDNDFESIHNNKGYDFFTEESEEEEITNTINIPIISEEEFAIFESRLENQEEEYESDKINLSFNVKSENCEEAQIKTVDINLFNLVYDEEKVYYVGNEESRIEVTNNPAFLEIRDSVIESLEEEIKPLIELKERIDEIETELKFTQKCYGYWQQINDPYKEDFSETQNILAFENYIEIYDDYSNPHHDLKIYFGSIMINKEDKSLYANYNTKNKEAVYNVFDADTILTNIQDNKYFKLAKERVIPKLECKIEGLESTLNFNIKKKLQLKKKYDHILQILKIWKKLPKQKYLEN